MTGSGEKGAIIVTGAAGFVGGYVVEALLQAGVESARIIAAHLEGETPPAGAGGSAVCNITDRGAVADLVKTYTPSVVIHLAAIAAPAEARANQDLAWAVNFDAVRYFGEALIAHVSGSRFVFAGSSESYGASFNAVSGAIPETTMLQPQTTYAATKAAADVLVGQLANEGIETVRFRAFNHTGPGQTPAFVVPAFASQIAAIEAGEQEPIVSVGDLSAERDFLDVRDVAAAYALAATRDLSAVKAPVFNLASGKPWAIRSILEALIAKSSMSIEVVTEPARVRPNDVPKTKGDISAAREHLGWSPEIPFEQTLGDVLDDWRTRKGCGS